MKPGPKKQYPIALNVRLSGADIARLDNIEGKTRAEKIRALIRAYGEPTGGNVVTEAAVLRERLKAAESEMTRAWILRELEHGGYYVNRAAYGRLASEHGPETYEEALTILEDYVGRTEVNEGVACYWALLELGHRDRAEAAVKRREARTK